MLKTNF